MWEDAATFVDPDDVERLVAVLDGLLADPALAADRGVEARRRAAAYRPEAMARLYLAAYRSLPLARAGTR